MKTVSIEEDGFLSLTVPGASTAIVVDIFTAAERLSRAAREADSDAEKFAPLLAAALAELGVPPLSHRTNSRIAKQIWDEARDAEKKDGLISEPSDGPELPDSTG